MFKFLIPSTLLVCLIFSVTGCSVMMALKQPDYQDTRIVQQGTSRTTLIGHFGLPSYTEKTTAGGRVDIFTFKQGYSIGHKLLRAFFHLTADLFTFFLWELVGTPTELTADGHDVKFKAVYDEQDNVISYEFFNK